MPEKLLPIYEIQDFNLLYRQADGLYLKTLEAHLQEHTFIQKPHKHNFFILILITNGSGTHTIDFITYPVKTNSVFFLSPGQVHSWQLSADSTGFVIFFSQEFYLLGHQQKKLFQFPFFNSIMQKPHLELTADEMSASLFIVEQLIQEYETLKWKQDDLLGDFLDILLIRLARIYQEKYAAVNAGNALSKLLQFENLIDEHYKEHWPVHFYAEQMNITPKQLNTICKQALGKNVTELIQGRIILEAKRLLVHSDLTVTQIAAELGYFDNSYFSRFFKKHSGQTPEQFRQNALS